MLALLPVRTTGTTEEEGAITGVVIGTEAFPDVVAAFAFVAFFAEVFVLVADFFIIFDFFYVFFGGSLLSLSTFLTLDLIPDVFAISFIVLVPESFFPNEGKF